MTLAQILCIHVCMYTRTITRKYSTPSAYSEQKQPRIKAYETRVLESKALVPLVVIPVAESAKMAPIPPSPLENATFRIPYYDHRRTSYSTRLPQPDSPTTAL